MVVVLVVISMGGTVVVEVVVVEVGVSGAVVGWSKSS